MSITKKELFKLCDENHDAINELRLQSDSTDFVLATLIQQLKDGGIISELGAEPQPQLKQLDQSIFNGLDEKWRFAAVDADGSANGFDVRVYPRGGDKYGLFAYVDDYANSDDNSIRLGEGYDTTNWQNSLIERDTAKELTGSELCKAMINKNEWVLAYVSDENDATAEFHQRPAIVTGATIDGRFKCGEITWRFAVPINNQGEPLTASEVGL